MAAFLTDAQVAIVRWVIDYNAGNYEKPLDSKSIEELSKLIPEASMQIQQAFRDRPLLTTIAVVIWMAEPSGVLSDANMRISEWVLDYITGAPDVPTDATAIHELSKIADSFGYSQMNFKEAMRDAPYTTLLRGLLVLNENA
jgi:hypothetical protein